MNDLLNLLNPLDNEAPTNRREALRKTGKLGAGLALASLPISAFIIPKVSFAGTSMAHGILNYALTLEYLEMFFYQQGTASGVIPDSDALAAFELVEKHEEDHVAFLTAVIESLDGPPPPVEFEADDFDFTAGGAFDPFNDYATFLLLSQGFEDTGVRAYKGQAAELIGTEYLTPALQIHALEARHAAYIRLLRLQQGAEVAPWILLDSDTDGTPLEAIYGAGMPADMFPPEENTVQAGVDLSALGFEEIVASASFDEPLDMETVLGIAGPFITGD